MATFRLAVNDTDDVALTMLAREEMQTALGMLVISRGTSFLRSQHAIYDDSLTIVCKEEGAVVGMGVVADIRARIMGGQSTTVGYLAQLRASKHVRGRTYLVRAYRFLRDVCEKKDLPLYLTTILEENVPARTLLESGRAGMPSYRRIARLGTFLFRWRDLRMLTEAVGQVDQRYSLVSECRDGLPLVWFQGGIKDVTLTHPTIVGRLAAAYLLESPQSLVAKKISIPVAYLVNCAHALPSVARGYADTIYALTLDERDVRYKKACLAARYKTHSILYGVEWKPSELLTTLCSAQAPVCIDSGLL